MNYRPLNSTDYARMSRGELKRRLTAVRDRMNRAGTTEEAIADLFCEQELTAALTCLTGND